MHNNVQGSQVQSPDSPVRSSGSDFRLKSRHRMIYVLVGSLAYPAGAASAVRNYSYLLSTSLEHCRDFQLGLLSARASVYSSRAPRMVLSDKKNAKGRHPCLTPTVVLNRYPCCFSSELHL